jgi:hypothetical protein
MKRTSTTAWFGSLALAVLTTACSSNRALLVVSNPPSATVYVTGTRVGDTPINVIMPFDASPRAFVQVAHPQRQSRMVILTPLTMPDSGEQAFDLPVGS